MRWAAQPLTVDLLRSELEKFAKDNLQHEFSRLREHIDRVIKHEVQMHTGTTEDEPPRGRISIHSAPYADALARTPSAPYDPPAGPVATAPQAVVGQPPPATFAAARRSVSTAGRQSELRDWATKRSGFASSQSEHNAFGRKTFSARSRQTTAMGEPPATNNAYTSLAVGLPPIEEPLDAKKFEFQEEEGSERGSRDLAVSSLREPSALNKLLSSRASLGKQFSALVVRTVETEQFDYLLGCCVMANAVSIGLETHYMAVNWTTEEPEIFRVVDRLFCLIFLIEVIMRGIASGCLGFFTDPGWRWNVFDLLVVAMQIGDEILRALARNALAQRYHLKGLLGDQISSMRILRLFRLVRLLRLTRMLYLLGGLRMLVVSIADSLRSLAWTLCLLFAITFVFGVFLTRLVTDFKVQHDSEEGLEKMEELLFFFGTLDRAMLCLFETISEGLHWHEVVTPLAEHCGKWLAVVFIAYMSFTLFALMNVVTGVFCESAIRTAEEDKRQVLLQQMHELFLAADEDGSGTISAEEFEAHLQDPQMLFYLKAIDVNPEEARHLFELLDSEDTGEIEAEELVNGCLRLQGSAKAIELAAFMQEHKVEYQRILEHVETVERSLSFVCDSLVAKGGRGQGKTSDQGAAA